MTTIPLGVHAYKRTFGAMPEIKLINRFVEQDPTNLREGTALLSRPGTTLLEFFEGDANPDPIRGLYSKPGLFNDDLFVVVGSRLYRYSEDGTVIEIVAFIGGTGRPFMTWDKGLTYEHMYISDGQVLSYYDGGSRASGVLTATVTATDQVVRIGSTYYAWSADVSTPGQAGTSANPFLVLLDGDPLLKLADAISYIGEPGVDFGAAIGGPNTEVTAIATGANAAATGTLTASVTPTTQVIEIGGTYYTWDAAVDSGTPDGTSAFPWRVAPGTDPIMNLANTLKFIGTPGTDFSSGILAQNPNVTATADESTVPALVMTVTARTVGPAGNAITTTIFSGTSISWADATLTGGSFISGTLTATAVSTGTDGNAIALGVTGTAGLSWSGATMTGGGVHTIHQILVPTGEGIGPLANQAHFIMCAVVGSIKFFYLRPGSVVMDALDFASKESNPDPILDLVATGDFVYIFGSGSTEVWYATGDLTNPLAPVIGRGMARGMIEGTAVNVNEDVLFVGNDGVVYSMNNGPVRISDNAIEERIRKQMRREKGLTP